MHSQPDSNCTDSYHSYPKIYNLGHKYLEHLFEGPFQVEEKLDGSQFSFGHFADPADPFAPTKIKCRSKGAEIDIDDPQKMFAPAVQWVKDHVLDLHIGWTYRAEWIPKPKANVLTYSRVPIAGLVVFDVSTGLEHYLDYDARIQEVARIGLECVRTMILVREEGDDALSLNEYKAFLSYESMLGGPKVEGIVIKNYNQFGLDGHAVFGKYVSEEFKEQHAKTPYTRGKSASVQDVILHFKTEARWRKSVQHLRESGRLLDDVKDIGALFKEIKQDFEDECTAEAGEILYKTFQREILQGITAGVAEWYKDELAKKQFAKEADDAYVRDGMDSRDHSYDPVLPVVVESNGEGDSQVVSTTLRDGSVV